MMTTRRARRALHFVPGDNGVLIEKASRLPVDGLIFDLEDSVVVDRKPAARERVANALLTYASAPFERWIRANGPATPFIGADIAGTIGSKPTGYFIPKVTGPADIDAVEAMIAEGEQRAGIAPGATLIIPMVTETPQGVMTMREVATRTPRIVALAWGGEDLSAAMGLGAIRDSQGRYLDVPKFARVTCAVVASACGLDALDAVFTEIANEGRFREECVEAVQMAFAGKLSIHPTQVRIINEEFTPSPEAVSDAQALVDAFDRYTADGVGVFVWKGNMVDVPHLVHARKILGRASLTRSSVG